MSTCTKKVLSIYHIFSKPLLSYLYGFAMVVNPPQQNFHLDNDNKNIYKNLLKSITAVYVYLANFVQSTFPLVNNITHYSSIIFIFGEIKWMDETRYRHHTKCTAKPTSSAQLQSCTKIQKIIGVPKTSEEKITHEKQKIKSQRVYPQVQSDSTNLLLI